MKNLAIAFVVLAAAGLCSCSSLSYSPDATAIEEGPISPVNTLHIVLDALERGDKATAQAHTLYGKSVDWAQVIATYTSQPENLRVRKVLYTDDHPEQHNCSTVYYEARSGKSNIVYFTKINGKWYWGNKINTAFGIITPPEASNTQNR